MDKSKLESKNTLIFFSHLAFSNYKLQSGNGFLDCYDPPRKVTYFANFLTPHATDNTRSDGIELEEGLICNQKKKEKKNLQFSHFFFEIGPQSSSSVLENYVNDQLFTRVLLENVKNFLISMILLFHRIDFFAF